LKRSSERSRYCSFRNAPELALRARRCKQLDDGQQRGFRNRFQSGVLRPRASFRFGMRRVFRSISFHTCKLGESDAVFSVTCVTRSREPFHSSLFSEKHCGLQGYNSPAARPARRARARNESVPTSQPSPDQLSLSRGAAARGQVGSSGDRENTFMSNSRFLLQHTILPGGLSPVAACGGRKVTV
jgi:hypothetical protein